MAKNNREIEKRIENAMDALTGKSRPNLKQIARDFDVPYQRFLSRVNGRKSLFNRPLNFKRLDDAQEASLIRYIDLRDNLGKRLRRCDIKAVATRILRQKSSSEPPLGDDWIRRFLQRHPEYLRHRRKALDIERAQALDKYVAKEWFESYYDAVSQYGITSSDIFNFDETGFMIGASKDQWIITREPRRKIVGATSLNCELVTVVEAVSTDCYTILLLIILKSKSILYRWFDHSEEDRHIATIYCDYRKYLYG
jgi:Tc5 transposase DNA-binding domain